MTILPKAIYRFSAIPYQTINGIFHRTINRAKKGHNLYGNTKDSKQPKQFWERKTELEKSGSLTSDYIPKVQSSKQYGIGTKTNISMKQKREPRNELMHIWPTDLWQRSLKYTIGKVFFSINGDRKTEQLKNVT